MVGHRNGLAVIMNTVQAFPEKCSQLTSSVFTFEHSDALSLALSLLVFEECQMQPQKFLYAGNAFSVTKYFALFFVTENISVFDK